MTEMGQAQAYVWHGYLKKMEGNRYVMSAIYHEAVASAQESIEFYVKACFYAVGLEPPTVHVFSKKTAAPLLEAIPTEYESVPLPRLLTLATLWGSVRGLAKFGDDFNTRPQFLFTVEDATLALKHAEECQNVATALLHFAEAGFPTV